MRASQHRVSLHGFREALSCHVGARQVSVHGRSGQGGFRACAGLTLWGLGAPARARAAGCRPCSPMSGSMAWHPVLVRHQIVAVGVVTAARGPCLVRLRGPSHLGLRPRGALPRGLALRWSSSRTRVATRERIRVAGNDKVRCGGRAPPEWHSGWMQAGARTARRRDLCEVASESHPKRPLKRPQRLT